MTDTTSSPTSSPPPVPKEQLSARASAILGLVQSLLPVMTAILGGLWAVFAYLQNQHETAAAADKQATELSITRRLEAQRPFLEKQLALYFEAAQVAGRLIGYEVNSKEFKEATNRFWELYWSELAMVEDGDVEGAMVSLGGALQGYQRNPAGPHSADDLRNASLQLAHAIRHSIEKRWSTSN